MAAPGTAVQLIVGANVLVPTTFNPVGTDGVTIGAPMVKSNGEPKPLEPTALVALT